VYNTFSTIPAHYQKVGDTNTESYTRIRIIIIIIIIIISCNNKEKNLRKTLLTNFKIRDTNTQKREREEDTPPKHSLSLSDGIFTEGPNVSSS